MLMTRKKEDKIIFTKKIKLSEDLIFSLFFAFNKFESLFSFNPINRDYNESTKFI